MKRPLLFLLLLGWCTLAMAQKSPKGTADIPLDYYLPKGYTYDPNIPTPKSFFGFEVGEWNADYDQIIRYFEKLAGMSPRVKFEIIGHTYEKRPQVMLTISSPENLSNLESIKSKRKEFRNPSANIDYKNSPLVLALGYSVHGNEASAINSSILAAYHFTAAKEIEADLKNMVITIDPALNPDGYNRYSTWVNAHRSMNLNGDPNNRELQEAWPGGRGNHYWFDLNRDWLLTQHPESQNRVATYQDWLPNVYLDYHEMGTNSTFFFQPGIPSRDHPLIPKKTVELTGKIAKYHAKAMDELGSLYYDKESFDEYYFGYGSTYPDIQGGVGILFEQASSRGHLQESNYGPLTFAFTIRNQFTTAVSSFEAARDMREELNRYLHDFHKEAFKLADADLDKAFIFGSKSDKARSFHLAEILQRHQIDIFALNENISVNGVAFEKEKSFIVPLKQPQYRLIKALFETRNEFQDSLFYDVSAWTMPMSFNLDFMSLSSKVYNLANVSQVDKTLTLHSGKTIGNMENAYAYAFEWTGYYAPKLTYALIQQGHLVRVTHETITLPDGKKLAQGSILVNTSRNSEANAKSQLRKSLEDASKDFGLDIYAVQTGYTDGIGLGSPQIDVLKKPEVALLVGNGITSTEVGEMWHLLDYRMDMPITLLPIERLGNADLKRYSVIVMPNGNYNTLGKTEADQLKAWTSSGGTLVARGNAMEWLNGKELVNFAFKKSEEEKETPKPYRDFTKNTGARLTSGTILHAKLDLSHPLAYGMDSEKIYTFRSNNLFLETSKNPYASPMVYTDNPLASGYIHSDNLEKVRNTAVLQVKKLGSGRVIGMVDNPNFRAIWYGTNKLFLNAVFFGQLIQSGTAD